jgi:hypothetical protein
MKLHAYSFNSQRLVIALPPSSRGWVKMLMESLSSMLRASASHVLHKFNELAYGPGVAAKWLSLVK